jgi:erythromycin esterase
MGSVLANDLGKDYFVMGFVFDRGRFQAIVSGRGLSENRLAEAPASDISTPVHRTGVPLLALALRHPPPGVVADWLAAAHPRRETDALFDSDDAMTQLAVLPNLFHAVLYVDETTRARPFGK